MLYRAGVDSPTHCSGAELASTTSEDHRPIPRSFPRRREFRTPSFPRRQEFSASEPEFAHPREMTEELPCSREEIMRGNGELEKSKRTRLSIQSSGVTHGLHLAVRYRLPLHPGRTRTMSACRTFWRSGKVERSLRPARPPPLISALVPRDSGEMPCPQPPDSARGFLGHPQDRPDRAAGRSRVAITVGLSSVSGGSKPICIVLRPEFTTRGRAPLSLGSAC